MSHYIIGCHIMLYYSMYLKALGISHEATTYTSDYIDFLAELMTKLIKDRVSTGVTLGPGALRTCPFDSSAFSAYGESQLHSSILCVFLSCSFFWGGEANSGHFAES